MKHFIFLCIGLAFVMTGCASKASKVRDNLAQGKVQLGYTRAKHVLELWGKPSSISAQLEGRKKNEFGFEGRKVERYTYKNRNLIMVFESGILIGFEALDNTRPGIMRPPRKKSADSD